MKTLRLAAVVLFALSAAACAGNPTEPTRQAADTARMDGTGYMGGGTRAP